MRSLHQLMHGNLAAALDLNPLMVPALPFLAYPFISYVLYNLRGKGLPRINIPPFLAWSILALVILFWILRNVPVYPFTVLAP